ncbi:hypothetical protein TNCV_3002401 [Trichonephila clavipes]|nr:hypothetical protein TNCV_3002401 [Trichonephila clavipes]
MIYILNVNHIPVNDTFTLPDTLKRERTVQDTTPLDNRKRIYGTIREFAPKPTVRLAERLQLIKWLSRSFSRHSMWQT